MGITPIDELISWLEALDVPVEETATRERFQATIESFLNAKTPEGRATQREALTKAMSFKYEDVLPLGVSPIKRKYKYGWELRFTIKGFRGLFGLEGMQKKTGYNLQFMWERKRR